MRMRRFAAALLPLLAFFAACQFRNAPPARAAAEPATSGSGQVTGATCSACTCEEIKIPMRDGTPLGADLYRPAGRKDRLPVLLQRLPYGKGACKDSLGQFFADRGYAVVTQDTRGRYSSQGDFYFIRDDGWGERQDGYDTVEWIAAQSWSNGKVGTYGGSYSGMTQYLMAPTRPPHLAAMYVRESLSDAYEDIWFRGGVLTSQAAGWALGTSSAAVPSCRDARVADFPRWSRDLRSVITHRPFKDFEPLKSPCTQWYQDWLAHPVNDSYWDQWNFYEKHDQVNVPIHHLGGWYDFFIAATTKNFRLQERGMEGARGNQRLIVGPWTHGPNYVGRRVVGDVDFGPEAAADYGELMLPWFDYWLKGIQTGVMEEPPVKLFIMGENRWRYEQEWPLARTVYTRFWLRGDEQLRRAAPADQEAPDTFVYDPDDPAPTVGGHLLQSFYNSDVPVGPQDQRSVEARADVLSYTTEPLDQAVEVTGPITVRLYGSSSARDTDFYVTLTDVQPSGYSLLLTDGILRARFRESNRREVLLEPGRVYPFDLQLMPTSNLFRKGHRIRVNITSSNVPQFHPNPNTGEPLYTSRSAVRATQTIFHDRDRPSHVVLPVIPRGGASTSGN